MNGKYLCAVDLKGKRRVKPQIQLIKNGVCFVATGKKREEICKHFDIKV